MAFGDGLKQLERKIATGALLEVRDAINSYAHQTVDWIRHRTLQGLRYDTGAAFHPYRPRTARRKRRFSPVNLFDERNLGTSTDHLLESLFVEEASTIDDGVLRAAVMVRDLPRRAGDPVTMDQLGRLHEFGTRFMLPRPWFGWTMNEKLEILDKLKNGVRLSVLAVIPPPDYTKVEI